ncbi:MAG TPA: FG-GAP-like repeat-containing protein [Myxococcales bacterium]
MITRLSSRAFGVAFAAVSVAASAAPVASFRVQGLPASVTAGVAAGFTVTAIDSAGNVVSDYAGTVAFSANWPNATVPASYAFVPADAGSHAFQLTAFSAGPFFVQATDSVSAGVFGTDSATVVAGQAANFAFNSLPSSTNAGVSANASISVFDTWWNSTNYSGTAVFTSSDPSAVLPVSAAFSGGTAIVPVTFNTAGGQSFTIADSANPAMNATAWTTVSSGPNATVTAPAKVTTGASATASVPTQAGVTYAWTVTSGTITAGANAATVTFTAGAAGTLTASCTVTNTSSAAHSTGSASVTVVALPATPVITAPAKVTALAKTQKATVPAHAGMTYAWTLSPGTITGTGGAAGITSAGVNTLTFTAPASGPITITCVEVNGAGTRSAQASATVQVASAPAKPVISAATPVTAGASSTAQVTAHSGMTYVWTITNGTITSAGGTAGVTSGTTNAITFTASAAGTLSLSCVETNGSTNSAAGTASVTVVAAPQAPVISTVAQTVAGTTGVTASVVAHTGMTYRWTVSNATITSTGGTSGVTSAGVNTATFTAGTAGSIALSAVEVNGAGAVSAPGTASVTVSPAGTPVTPVITTKATVTAGASVAASVVAHAGMTYSWTVSNGTITSAGGAAGTTSGTTNSITYTAGPAGNIVVTCTESNGQTSSTAGTASQTSVTPASVPTISTVAQATSGQGGITASVVAHPGMTYSWTISGGTITSAGGAAGVIAGGNDSITYSAGGSASLQLTCAEIDGAGTASARAVANVSVGVAGPGNGIVYVMAHQDDEIYFMEPDAAVSLQSGRPTTLVWITAGSSGDGAAVWQARENQSRAAAANTVGLASNWTCGPRLYLGRLSPNYCTLNGAPQIVHISLRLPDGGTSALWATDGGAPFFVAPVSTLTSADGTSVYSRSDVVQVLTQILADSSAAVLGTMDSTLAYGDDHTDHHTAGLFALEAARAYGRPLAIQIYRGYSIDGEGYYPIPVAEAQNLSSADIAEKVSLLSPYGLDCTGSFGNFCPRRYAVSRVAAGTSALVSGGSCLDSSSGTPVLAACNGSLAQSFSVQNDGTVRTSAGSCLAAAGSALSIATCDGTVSQSFLLFGNGQLRGPNASCVETSGGALLLDLCTPDRSSSNYRPLASQTFTQVFSAPVSSGIFPDAQVPAGASYAGSFRLADVDGDGVADACIRLADGVHCARGDGAGGFAPESLWSSDFSDANGWSADANGSTLMFGDLNGDGRADVCARSASGVVCALALATGGFGPSSLWSADFSDAQSFGSAQGYYGSLRLADVTGDGYADLCGRGPGGIVCAVNSRSSSFLTATPWTTDDFTDALGWLPAQYGATLMFADIDGDGLADVCGRGPAGVRCATASAGGGFRDSRPWSNRTDFSDAAGWNASAASWGSLRLADVDGDGKADLCGRSALGFVCGISNGGAFDTALLVSPNAFTDALGYSAAVYGSSAAAGDLNRDGHRDLCARSAAGVVCAKAPGVR